jgi:hypothetical protein
MSNKSFCPTITWVLLASALAEGQQAHLRDTDPVDVGTVISRGRDSVTVKNDLFTRVFQITAQTQIQRVDHSAIQIGDLVAVRCHFDNEGGSIADNIEANVDHWEGVITRVHKDTVDIKFDAPVKGTAEVILDAGTKFDYCATDDPKRECAPDDLKVGRHLDAVGFVVERTELNATSVLAVQRR